MTIQMYCAPIRVSLGKRLEMEGVDPRATIRSSSLGNKEMRVTLRKVRHTPPR